MLTTAANNALAADATVPEGVEATARNGNLTLTGTVQYLSQRAAVEKVVSGLIGVRHVRNEIGVVCGVEPTDVKQLVGRALDRSALVPDDSDVRIDTSGSTVILTGHVGPGPSATRWSAPRGWRAASQWCRRARGHRLTAAHRDGAVITGSPRVPRTRHHRPFWKILLHPDGRWCLLATGPPRPGHPGNSHTGLLATSPACRTGP